MENVYVLKGTWRMYVLKGTWGMYIFGIQSGTEV